MLVCTLGDLLLDVIVRLDSRLAPGDDAAAATTLAPGGQAANVAAWAAALGANARIVAVQADDDAGAILRRELESARRRACAGRAASAPASSSRSCSRTATGRWPPTAAPRPSLRAEDLDGDWLDVRRAASLRLLADARADRRRGGARRRRSRGSAARASASTSRRGRTSQRFGDADARARSSGSVPTSSSATSASGRRSATSRQSVRVVKRGARGISVDGEEHPAHRRRRRGLDRSRRRARRRLHRRRRRACARDGRALRRAGRSDAVKIAPMTRRGFRRAGARGATSRRTTSTTATTSPC